jgi:hypothetical protein
MRWQVQSTHAVEEDEEARQQRYAFAANTVEARVAATRGRSYTQSRLVFGVCACTQHSPLTTHPRH